MKCHECKFRTTHPTESPCNECLHNPVGEYDHFEEIKDEPVSADEFVKSLPDDGRDEHCERCWVQGNRNGFKAGEENQKKCHRPQQSFEEWWNLDKSRVRRVDLPSYHHSMLGWQACLKAHGLGE